MTINSASGVITTASAALIFLGSASFTVTNSAVSSTSVVTVSVCNYTGNGIPYVNNSFADLNENITVSNVANGSFTINIVNLSAVSLSAHIKISFICA